MANALRIFDKRYAPVNRCIYCGSTRKLSDEHIIPLSLWGRQVLPKASCRDCAAITSSFELIVSRQILGAARAGLRAPSRRKRPASVRFRANGVDRTMKYEDVPPVIFLPRLSPPDAVMISRPAIKNERPDFWLSYLTDSMNRAIDEYGLDGPIVPDFTEEPFYRMLAKIAHSFMVAELQIKGKYEIDSSNLLLTLPGIILGTDKGFRSVVGGFHERVSPTVDLFHRLELGVNKHLIFPTKPFQGVPSVIKVGASVKIWLFEWLGAPEYLVVAAKAV